ncbi:hypothetical protein [Microcoleus vaginatus]
MTPRQRGDRLSRLHGDRLSRLHSQRWHRHGCIRTCTRTDGTAARLARWHGRNSRSGG